MKTCSKCKVQKDEADFSKETNRKDGLSYHCKSCEREYHQTAARKASQKAYKQTDAYKASQKAYQQTDAYKAYQKKAYQKRKALAASLPGNLVS